MKKSLILVCIVIFLLVIVISCSNDETDTPIVPPQPQSLIDTEMVVPTTEQITLNKVNQIVFNEILEKYYDYFRVNNQIVALLDYPYDENGFTDDALAAFAIMSLEDYDYEKGNHMEEYDTITDKYFGRKINNFNNSMSEIIHGTNMVRATGWSFDSGIYMILKSHIEESDGSKTAEFYTLNISDSAFMDLPQKTGEEIKKDLLSGEFSMYGEPFIVEMKFEEKADENGNMYLKYLEIKIIDEIVDSIVPYGSK